VFRAEPAVRVHVRRDERGLASAIYRGIREARGDVVVIMDSDGNHDPALLPLMVRCVEDFDVVIGSRYVSGAACSRRGSATGGSYAFNILIRIVLGLRIHDNSQLPSPSDRRCFAGSPPRPCSTAMATTPSGSCTTCGPRGRPRAEIPTVYRFRKGASPRPASRVPLDVPRLGVPAWLARR
jgi:dolichol-phosphate mannosyltransferase